ncbi:Staphylococcal nuclease-like [compost metagenome]
MLLKKASLAGAFFVSAIWLAPAQAFCPAPSGLPIAHVRQVVDGDTLRLQDGRSVRLIGINAPEIGRKGKPTEPFADAARKRLQALVDESDGRVGLLLGQQARDHYGRTLAHVFGSTGNSFEAQLLGEGLGYLVAVAPNVDLVACQQHAEGVAREGRLGVWRQSPVVAAERLSQSGFALISGRVTAIERNRGGIWLELGANTVLHVPAKLQRSFPSSAFDGLEGRQVVARGWVIDRSRRGGLKPGQARWMLPLTAPAMLERAQ